MQRAFEKIIEKLKKEKSKHRYDRGEFWCYRDAIEIVNQVASEYGGGWIPCSERLPEAETEEVLVTDGDFVYLDQWNEEEQSFEMNTDIIAWQPLPKPYQPNICNDTDCPYNDRKECPASEGCAGYESEDKRI